MENAAEGPEAAGTGREQRLEDAFPGGVDGGQHAPVGYAPPYPVGREASPESGRRAGSAAGGLCAWGAPGEKRTAAGINLGAAAEHLSGLGTERPGREKIVSIRFPGSGSGRGTDRRGGPDGDRALPAPPVRTVGSSLWR